MNLKFLLRRIFRKLVPPIFHFFGYDNFTGLKITKSIDLIHLGSKNAKWVIPKEQLTKASICYCVGCGEDISFDLSLIEVFGCDVYAFDPTPRAIEYANKLAGKNKKYHFYETGLWSHSDTLKFYTPANPENVSHSIVNLQKTTKYIELKVDRLKSIMDQLGHRHLDLLKIDIEGAEYQVIKSIVEDKLEIKTICVEFDEYFHAIDKQYRARITDCAKSILALGYILVWAQGDGNYTFTKK
ncbi:FkbM family methyltransferase [Bdellovibrio bacteriovorus]|uniref:FkbM family methyltransferase n=1 Tax=Bdellovibrio bacteriovorus TaxID=959 RepID=UPI003A80CBB5